MRESGRICCSCKVTLESPPANSRERYCERCEPRQRIYMHFMLKPDGWHISFLERDLKTSLPRSFVFQDSAKVIKMAMRGGSETPIVRR